MRINREIAPVYALDAKVSIMGRKYKAVILWNLKT